MSSTASGYDLDTSQFSPDGRVFQVEYAQKATENSGTAIALRAKDGVVFAVEKTVSSKLYEVGANRRLFTIDKHIGMAVGGLYADGRQIVEIARSEASKYRTQYGADIPVQFLTDRLAMYFHAYTMYGQLRPFGCSVILGSQELSGSQIYMIDPSGTNLGYKGCAIGKAKQAAKTEMEKLKLDDASCEELIREAAKIIYLVHDEVKDKMFELELSWVGKHTGGLHQRVPEQVFKDAEAYAKSALEDSELDADDS